MSEDWKRELERIKETTEKGVIEARKREDASREKYKRDVERVIELINSQLEPVAETFREEGREEADQPKIAKYPNGIRLSLPVVHKNTRIGLGISFDLTLSDEGYVIRAKATKDMYDQIRDKVGQTSEYISPVEPDNIQKEIKDFLLSRSSTIKVLEEREIRMKREMGI